MEFKLMEGLKYKPYEVWDGTKFIGVIKMRDSGKYEYNDNTEQQLRQIAEKISELNGGY